MATKKTKSILAKMVQITVHVGAGGHDEDFDFSIRASEEHDTLPRDAEYSTSKADTKPKTVKLLKEILHEIENSYGQNRIRLCIMNDTKIVRKEFCE